MAGKRRTHKPKYKPKNAPIVSTPGSPIEPSKPIYSEPPLIVFVSSLIDKMSNERDAVTRAVRSIPITRDWRFENVPASSQPVEESYLSKVRTCDIFVLVLGSSYSAAVVREYETAIESGRPTLAFVTNREREAAQNEFVASITAKRASYGGSAQLEALVAGAILDELIRAHRSVIRPTAASQVISRVPLPTRKLEDLIGYFVIGLDNIVLQNFYRRLGAETVPSNLQDLYPHLEPLPVLNVFEVNTAVNAIQDANLRSRSAPNRGQAFGRELQKKVVELASYHLKRKKTGAPEPEVHIPGITYYLWGMEHSFARIVKLLRLEDTLKEPVRIERTDREVMFRDADHFLKLTTKIQEAAQNSHGDVDELDRLISVAAGLLALEDSQGE